MHTRRVFSLALSLFLGGSLLYGCGTPATRPISAQPVQNRSNDKDPFISQAKLALASYQEVDASFADSRRLASARFSAKQASGTGSVNLGGDASGALGDTQVDLGTDTSADADVSVGEDGVSASADGSTSVNTGASSDGSSADASASADTSTSVSIGSGAGSGGSGGTGGSGGSGGTGGSGGGTGGTGGTGGSSGGSASASGSGSANVSSSGGIPLGGIGIDLGGSTNVNLDASTDANDLDVGLGSNLGASLDGSAALNSSARIAAQIDAMVNSSLSGSGNFNAALNLFNRAASQFSAELLASESVDLDATGNIEVNTSRLSAQVSSELQGDAELATNTASLDGKLDASAHTNLALDELSNLGFSASSSDVSVQASADGSSSESVLLSFDNLDAELTNEVLVTTVAEAGSGESEVNLRLDTQAEGFVRTGLQEIVSAGAGSELVRTELDMKLENGTTVEISEERFVTLNGAGAGFGSFNITTAGGQSFSGTLRTMVSANGNLVMMLDPSDSSLGSVMLQEKASGKANLVLYSSSGDLEGSSELDLESTLDAMVES